MICAAVIEVIRQAPLLATETVVMEETKSEPDIVKAVPLPPPGGAKEVTIGRVRTKKGVDGAETANPRVTTKEYETEKDNPFNGNVAMIRVPSVKGRITEVQATPPRETDVWE